MRQLATVICALTVGADVALAQDAGPRLDPALVATIDAADDEGRWIALRDALDGDPASLGPWVDHLGATGAFTTLEWLAVHGGPTESLRALDELHEHDAPQWIRCAVWCRRNSFDSHTLDRSTQLLESSSAKVWSWSELHGDAVSRSGILFDPSTLPIRDRAEPVDHYAPPLRFDEVFAPLRAPEFREYGAEAPPEDERPFVSAVVRALEGYGHLGVHTGELAERVQVLSEHADERVALAARLAYTHFAPSEVPWRLLAEQARRADDADALRQAALLGFSYGPHNVVYVALSEIALLERDSPLWVAAISRLGDLGDAFVAEALASVLDGLPLGSGERTLVEGELALIRDRIELDPLQGPGTGPTPDHMTILELPGVPEQRALERLAWAGLSGSALEPSLRAWTLEELTRRARRDERVRGVLRALAAEYVVPAGVEAGADLGGIEPRVRADAELVLERASTDPK